MKSVFDSEIQAQQRGISNEGFQFPWNMWVYKHLGMFFYASLCNKLMCEIIKLFGKSQISKMHRVSEM